jgi:dimethylsulfone monooxygenase
MLQRAGETSGNNPLYGPNRFKLGLFNVNCNGGLTISLAPERWAAEWDDVVAATVMADRAGIDFILPVAKWHGYGGQSNNLSRSFETLTHGAALGALTRRIAMFSTVHVPAGYASVRGESHSDHRSCDARPSRAGHCLWLES